MKTTFPVLAVLCGFLATEYLHQVGAETNEIAESNFGQLRHKRAVLSNPGGTPVVIGEEPIVAPGPVVPGPETTTKKPGKKTKKPKRPKKNKPGKRPKKSKGPKKDKKNKGPKAPKKDKKNKGSKGQKKDKKAKGSKKSNKGKKAKDAKPAGP